MLFHRQRHEFFMKELHLLALWQVRHVVNYGYFLRADVAGARAQNELRFSADPFVPRFCKDRCTFGVSGRSH